MTDTQLLKEAYRRYPIGAKFKSTISDGGEQRIVVPYHDGDKEMTYEVSIRDGKKRVYVRKGMKCGERACSNPSLWHEDLGWCPLVGDFNYEIY